MGDMAEDFAAMKAHRQQQHANWKRENMDVLNASGLVFKLANNGETILFRERGRPSVDFYPSTGRWRVVGADGSTHRGGAVAFFTWYRRQRA